MRLLTDAEVIATFGDPHRYMGTDGRISDEWPARILGHFTLPFPMAMQVADGRHVAVYTVTCHKIIQPFLRAALYELHSNADAWREWGNGGYGGCYEFRRNRKNPAQLSRHSWGIAIDGDVLDNPQGSPPQMHPFAIDCFEKQGFIWGGRFHGNAVDGMHFEASDELVRRLA